MWAWFTSKNLNENVSKRQNIERVQLKILQEFSTIWANGSLNRHHLWEPQNTVVKWNRMDDWRTKKQNKKYQKHRRSTCFFGRKQKLSILQKKKKLTCLALYHSKSRHSQGHSQHLQQAMNTDNAHAPSRHLSPSTVAHTYGSSFTAWERFTPREDSSLPNQKWHSLKLSCKHCVASPMQTLVGGNQTKRAEETKGPSVEAMWVEKGDKANSTGCEEGCWGSHLLDSGSPGPRCVRPSKRL